MRAKQQNIDLRDIIFEDIKYRRFIAAVISEEEGLVSGVDLLKRRGEEIGVEFLFLLKEGRLGAPVLKWLYLQFVGQTILLPQSRLLMK